MRFARPSCSTNLQLTVVLHGDEEDSGRPLDLARRDLIDAAKAADIAIGLENAAEQSEDRGHRASQFHWLGREGQSEERALLADICR